MSRKTLASQGGRETLRTHNQREESLRNDVRASMADKRPSVSIGVVFKRVRMKLTRSIKGRQPPL
jgi:hypothetical protein